MLAQRASAHNDPRRYGKNHDVILFYVKTGGVYTWNQQYSALTENNFASHDFETDEEGRKFRKRDLSAPGHGANSGQYEWKGKRPPQGRMWSYTETNMAQLERENRIVYTRTGMPRLKIFVEDLRGIPFQDVWARPELWLNAAAAERLGYPTQKPEALMERIIRASSNEGDVILDAYCGCGTTVAVAQRLNRRWIGMDVTYQAIALILKRLEDAFGKDVAAAVQLGGVPKDMESATALAHKKEDRTRKEFEKWAVLTYTENRGAINDKKGADAGIDGTAYFLTNKSESDTMVFQVKSGHVGRGDIAKLKGDMQREKAALATFIKLEESTAPMRAEAKAAGFYTHSLTGRRIDQIRIVSIRDMLERGCRMELPLGLDVLNAAERIQPGTEQGVLDLRDVKRKAG